MTQKPVLTLLATACALAVPALAHSRQVTLNVQLKDYGGQLVACFAVDQDQNGEKPLS